MVLQTVLSTMHYHNDGLDNQGAHSCLLSKIQAVNSLLTGKSELLLKYLLKNFEVEY